MIVSSINVGQSQAIQHSGKAFETGIYKLPVQTPVEITAAGLAGDVICNKKHHGGVDQAIYVYGTADYAWWSTALERQLAPGTFGENLTVKDLESTTFKIGDRLLIGNLILEVTAPRIPCGTLAARMNDANFVKKFRAAERPGFYCRVITPGTIQKGDSVKRHAVSGETISVIEMFRDAYAPQLNEDTLRRYLAAPIAIRDRIRKEKRLRQLIGQPNAQASK